MKLSQSFVAAALPGRVLGSSPWPPSQHGSTPSSNALKPVSPRHQDGREEEAVLWFGIIDFLQPYNTSKRLGEIWWGWMGERVTLTMSTVSGCSEGPAPDTPWCPSHNRCRFAAALLPFTEHGLKSVIHSAASISVSHPVSYANRFQNFMQRVFVP